MNSASDSGAILWYAVVAAVGGGRGPRVTVLQGPILPSQQFRHSLFQTLPPGGALQQNHSLPGIQGTRG